MKIIDSVIKTSIAFYRKNLHVMKIGIVPNWKHNYYDQIITVDVEALIFSVSKV